MKKETIKSVSIYIGIFISMVPAIIMQFFPADIDSLFRIVQVLCLIVGAMGMPKIIEITESYLNSNHLEHKNDNANNNDDRF
ncbi:hypothetical protein AKG98_3172 [Moritella sp. JT01]|uniref:hypothetical protein n=1 Tax=Moritella sp. JT01 TaxID=756698 RepID=UPI0007978C99|nr:hypothetical protein [Moritella sp. JT01]KXO06513.1 hypothetical protein AKG98_3172 [Moritella sp. JT01]